MAKDTAEAARWYQAAATQGDAEAQAALGRVGEVQGLDEAIAAYERGDHPRTFTLLTHLANERDMKTREAAAKWYQAASKSGNADAAFNLAMLYEQGRGIAPDRKKAWEWYRAAEVRGHQHAAAALERFQHQSRSGSTTERVSDFDAAVAAYDSKNFASAIEQFQPLAQAGNVDAQLYLGVLYEWQRRSHDEAIRWFRAAAEQGDAEGQYQLALIYRLDRVDRDGRRLADYAEAVRWLKTAAEQGHPGAQRDLGQAYRDGKGVSRDRTEANRWYRTAIKTEEGLTRLIEPQCAAVAGVAAYAAVYAACNRGDDEETFRQLTVLAKQGNARAQDWLGYLHYQGLPGIQKHRIYIAETSHGYFQRSARCIGAAAEQGYAPAQYNLGVVYEHGMGVPANLKEAIRWYQAAASQKNTEAQAALKRLGQ